MMKLSTRSHVAVEHQKLDYSRDVKIFQKNVIKFEKVKQNKENPLVFVFPMRFRDYLNNSNCVRKVYDKG